MLLYQVWKRKRVAAWVALGVAGSLVELALLRGLIEGLLWPLPVATAFAAEVLIVCKFLLADRWVFRHQRPTVNRLIRYHGASAGALVVYWLVINWLGLIVGMVYVVAFVVGTAASFIWSFLTNFLWVWAQPARSQVE
jgi:putative flippase GtrA